MEKKKTNTNAKVLEEANAIINSEGSRKTITLISEYYEQQKLKLLIETLQKRDSDIIGQMVINENNLHLIEYGKKRSGRPKYNWYLNAISKYWQLIETQYKTEYRYTPLNLNDISQENTIIQAAEEGWPFSDKNFEF